MTKISSVFSNIKNLKRLLLFYSLVCFLFLFTIFLCILFLSFTCRYNQLPCSHIVYAKESKAQNFSEACKISGSSKKKISLPAYDSCFYYFEDTSVGNVTIQINPSSNLQVFFYSDKGQRLSLSNRRNGKSTLFILDKSYWKKYSRIFLQIKNKTNISQKCILSTTLSKEHISHSRKHKQTIKKKTTSIIPSTKQTKIKSQPKSNATEKKNYCISPNFLHCKAGKKVKLKLLRNNRNVINSSVIWTSSNPSVAKIKQGVLTPNNKGISVILVRKNEIIFCSCLVRVTD